MTDDMSVRELFQKARESGYMSDDDLADYADDDWDDAINRVYTYIQMNDDDPEEVLHSWGVL